MKPCLRIAKKEFSAFFTSPVAFIFLGAFLAVSLFTFFWIETFFSTNIAEIRPLFKWMPILLIFLTAAVTMRQWAEERRMGTLEFLMTAPIRPLHLVLGKFLACLWLVLVALLLTLPLPLTISFLGNIDWGPVAGGYLATIFLAAAYIAIGLYVSLRSDNQIVSLITTSLICGCFYLIGSPMLVSFLGNRGSEILQLFGTGSRFNSIIRGVIDFRDIYYYVSITLIFLCLNWYTLESIRWDSNPSSAHHRRWTCATALILGNILLANFWLAPIGFLRVDLTKGSIYSISDATKNYLNQLQEPLLIRGYFSAQTHPLLAPLVPRLRDLLAEYAVIGGKKVHIECIDPAENPELEQEAGQKYGIRPVPFQTASKYQTAVTNSYFNILIQYGDQFETLSFRDLIEVKAHNDEDFEVELRNPEYDITKAIKKVLYGFKGGGDLFAGINGQVTFSGYLSPDRNLPKELVSLKASLNEMLAELKKAGGDHFSSSLIDPDADNGAIARKISSQYGFQPMSASLFDQRKFWFYMTLGNGSQTVEIPLPEDLSKDGLKRSMNAALKRFSKGFSKTIAIAGPQSAPPMPSQVGLGNKPPQFSALKEVLSAEHTLIETDLQNGSVPADADLLLVLAPKNLSPKQVFAIDQFLMLGGTVIIAASPFEIIMEGGLAARKTPTGLEDWLGFHGISLKPEMILDPRNSPFPVPVQRNLGGFAVEETHMVNYPYFLDIRNDGMNERNPMTTGLTQITMNWASPIEIDQSKNSQRQIARILESSRQSWSSDATLLQPDFRRNPEMGFTPTGEPEKKLVAAAVSGKFTSFFTGKPSPVLTGEPAETPANQKMPSQPPKPPEQKQIIGQQIDLSPENSRILLFASSTFANDTMLNIGSAVTRTNYLNPAQAIANAIDWTLEDQGLLSIRGRSHYSRSLAPLPRSMQVFWEYLNYGLAGIGLTVTFLTRKISQTRTRKRNQSLIQSYTVRTLS